MSSDDRERWDRAHATSHHEDRPSAFLRYVFQHFGEMLPRGRALDIACGKGRNALFLAEEGFDVTAIDISAIALDITRTRAAERRLSVSWEQQDLEQVRLREQSYDLIVNFNYLQRSLFTQISRSLR